MKIKPFWIALPLLALTIAAFLIGRALTAKAVPVLPPTGAPVRAPQMTEAHHWLDTGFRWSIYSENGELLEELEELENTTAPASLIRTQSSFDKPARRRVSGELRMTGGAVRGELVEPRTERPEPTIRQAQMAAIRYAEVRPEKIQRWRTLAQLRNFVPRFTLGLDRDSDTTIGSSSSGGKTTFTVGPQDESLSVDFGFTWDLANLVWDSAQTSIDVRSRLMVQLRQDILEETTRIYFERQRLMTEFEASPAEDPLLQKERSLRLEELTAQLDALTGGLYSDSSEWKQP